MAKVRKYRLSDTSQNVDLRQYEDEIIQTINDTVPGKHPKVYPDYFSTDQLSQSEAVKIGRALSKSCNLSKYGKIVTTFRLFSGRTVEQDICGPCESGRIAFQQGRATAGPEPVTAEIRLYIISLSPIGAEMLLSGNFCV